MSYDADLNQTDDGTSPFVFVYDANDRLKQVKDRASQAVFVEYRYDALGRRVEKLIAGKQNNIVRYYYTGDRIAEERDGNDAVVASYTYGNYIDEPLTMDRGGNRYYYHSNRLFSTYALTDAAGSIVERYVYTAYGEVVTFNAAYQQAQSSSRVGNPFTFTGREFDAETGSMHFRARTYDTVQGRFKQRDPDGYMDSMNIYAAGFIPNNLDPKGTDILDWLFGSSTIPCRLGEIRGPISTSEDCLSHRTYPTISMSVNIDKRQY
jgi:RHS repeat-associated protein